jgi:endonuclease YncB( thermonuclease family)
MSMGRMPTDEYTRVIFPVAIIDGDTFVGEVDLGFYCYVRMSCRLAGLNAAEHNQPGGREATVELTNLLAPVDEDDIPVVVVRSVHADKFAGRFDAEVYVSKRDASGAMVEIFVNQRLIELGVAVPWDGRGQRPLVPWPPTVGPYAKVV